MQSVLLPIKSVKVNPNNPRILKDEKFNKLKQSITDAPWMLDARPIVIDEDNIVLGGNMRYQALKDLGYKEIHCVQLANLTPEQKQEFIIKDNVSFGEWDWEVLANEWDLEKLEEWGLDLIGTNVDEADMGDSFSLPDGDKAPFQQITFTLADEQATEIQNAIADIKLTDEYKYMETMGNENSNGNAIYLIVQQWAEQKK